MTEIFVKNKRVQILLPGGLLPPPPDVIAEIEVEIEDLIEVEVCKED